MVGVAGKSKACGECKRRRVRCGFERPRCLRCAKAGLQCSGYEQRRLFVNRTLNDRNVSAPEVMAQVRALTPVTRSSLDELNEIVSLCGRAERDPLTFRLLAFKMIKRLYLPRADVSDNGPDSAAAFSWVSATCELDAPNEVLDHALVAFCTSQVYVTEAGSMNIDHAMEAYATALRMLSSALADEAITNPDYLLASIVVLSICELFICFTDDGWRVHVQGIADVLQLKRSESNSRAPTDIWNKLCSRLRLMSILSQLIHRQKNSLTASQWNQLMPFAPNTDHVDRLMNISCDLPQELEIVDKLLSDRDGSEHERAAAAGRLVCVLSTLYALLADFHQSFPEPLYTTVPAELTNPADEVYGSRIFPFVLRFRSLQVASCFIVTWAILLHIHSALLRLSRFGTCSVEFQPSAIDLLMWSRSLEQNDERDFKGDYSALPEGSLKEEADKLARHLCQSVEYCHKPEMGTFGPQTMCYSHWIVQLYFRLTGAERELLWAVNTRNMRGAPTRCGILMMAFGGTI